ncbi:hypothetical protein H6758_02325 [Candidatus Nomurabacteria bacterium]|nr:hypothetical protein [Candidatus Nomurabacteria bacterium]
MTKEIEHKKQEMWDRIEKRKLAKMLSSSSHPEQVIGKFKEMLKKYNKDAKAVSDKEFDDKFVKAAMTLGLETHFPLAHATRSLTQPLAIEFANSLSKEFKVSNSAEKALVQIVANSYVRVMNLSSQLNDVLHLGHATNNLNGFYAAVSKDLDRAHRQFVSSLTLLRELKMPPIKVNVHTKAAFIAQNQQLNNNPYENDKG